MIIREKFKTPHVSDTISPFDLEEKPEPVYNPPKILRNRAMCNRCGDIIESLSVHDFKTCSCGNLSVDGGHEYIRRVFGQGMGEDDWKELSEYK